MTAMLSTTALFIPLMTTMLNVFACDSTWLSTEWQCFQGIHLVLVFVVACIALLFAGFALIGAKIRYYLFQTRGRGVTSLYCVPFHCSCGVLLRP
jgi:hypothetical protein